MIRNLNPRQSIATYRQITYHSSSVCYYSGFIRVEQLITIYFITSSDKFDDFIKRLENLWSLSWFQLSLNKSPTTKESIIINILIS